MKLGKKTIITAMAFVLMAIVATWAVASTWTSARITMMAHSAESVQLSIFSDSAATMMLESIDWDGITQGNKYEKAIFVWNGGTRGLYVTYLPSHVFFDEKQTHLVIKVWVWEQGLPSQLWRLEPPLALQTKNATQPIRGFWLEPGKMIKLIVELNVMSVVANQSYMWNFTVYGSTGE